MTLSRPLRLLLLSASLITAVPSLQAQQNLRPLTVELSAAGGGVFDLPSATAHSGICGTSSSDCTVQTQRGKKFLPLVGGGVVLSLNRWIGLYGNYDYVFPDRHSTSIVRGRSTDATTVTRHYWSATGGFEFSFPTIHGVVPVLRVGAGQVHHSYNYFDIGTNVTPPIFHFTDARGIPAGEFGGGIRWYLRERQGLRFMVNGIYLGRSIDDFQPSPFVGTAHVTRRSGGSVTIGYFIDLGH